MLMRTDNLDMRHARFCQNIQASNLFSTQKRMFIRSVVFFTQKNNPAAGLVIFIKRTLKI